MLNILCYNCSYICSSIPQHMQSMMLVRCSSKHHHTSKCSHRCGAVTNITIQQGFLLPALLMEASHVSPLHARSKSDVELTCVSAFLDTLKTKPGVSNMADCGFPIQDRLKPLVNLNIPPFMKGRKQLLGEEVLKEDMQLLCMLQ